MTSNTSTKEMAEPRSKRQQLFIKYTLAILVDLMVLGLFNEYWDLVKIDSFSIALIAALMLQVLLKLTIKFEHYVGGYFDKKPGTLPKITRFFTAWTILFISKIIILEAINFAFGDHVLFLGAWHGIVAFIVVVIGILLAEWIISKIYNSLA